MIRKASASSRDGKLLSQALKLVRRYRGMTSSEVAVAMCMPIRTYERFEAGDCRLNIDYIHRFALATDSDPHAFLMAVAVGSPELAWRCADNKLITTIIVGVKRSDRALGDRLQTLESRDVIAAVMAMITQLNAQSQAQEAATKWLEDGTADLRASRPRPGR